LIDNPESHGNKDSKQVCACD